MNNMQVKNIFPTPIWQDKFYPDEEYFKICVDFCLERKKDHPEGVKKSNAGGWQSSAVTREIVASSPFEKFFSYADTILPKITLDLSTEKKWGLGNTWININEKTNSNVAHIHPLCMLSGVYYLTDNNSDIVFYKNDPLHFWYTGCIESRCDTEYTSDEFVITPKKGDVLFFYPHLKHSVKPCTIDNGMRISIAFNYVLY